ncbi:hypothetical protein Hanom_Chr15g01386571 [Helianthus anomalus]
MASKQLLYTLLLLYISLNSPATTVAQCPYPCYPPPIPGANTPPTITMPPPGTTLPPPSQTGSYTPPGVTYAPPSRIFPYNPSTPTYYGGAPPPPDPIVPWFPFYYTDPPRNPGKSSSDRPSGSMVVIFLLHVVVLQLLFS